MIFEAIQKRIKIKRKIQSNIELKYGSNWFSITNELAEYVVNNEKWINKYFKYTLSGDELFLQTLVYNSKFKEKLYIKEMNDNYKSSIRYIDWKRGKPYILKKKILMN